MLLLATLRNKQPHRVPCIWQSRWMQVPRHVRLRERVYHGGAETVHAPAAFDGFMRMRQQAEIRKANISGCEQCPFCEYSAIMDQPADEEPHFQCQADACRTKSCRKCKKVSHHPDSCTDAEMGDIVHQLAEAMTNGLVRECPACKRKFLKEYGCNKMVCICGQYMCYVCRKPITGYDHFGNPPVPGSPCDLAGCT
ncbi:hypothetical protein BC831DRAFT_25202 [Entophlyctis helioformis]|nr:hypothetical protein BC831DRAFT_25202 [Entophlyctis helioformis]